MTDKEENEINVGDIVEFIETGQELEVDAIGRTVDGHWFAICLNSEKKATYLFSHEIRRAIPELDRLRIRICELESEIERLKGEQ